MMYGNWYNDTKRFLFEAISTDSEFYSEDKLLLVYTKFEDQHWVHTWACRFHTLGCNYPAEGALGMNIRHIIPRDEGWLPNWKD